MSTLQEKLLHQGHHFSRLLGLCDPGRWYSLKSVPGSETGTHHCQPTAGAASRDDALADGSGESFFSLEEEEEGRLEVGRQVCGDEEVRRR